MCIRRRLQQGLTISSSRQAYPVTSGQDSEIDFVHVPEILLYDIAIILIDSTTRLRLQFQLISVFSGGSILEKIPPVLVISNLVK